MGVVRAVCQEDLEIEEDELVKESNEPEFPPTKEADEVVEDAT